VKMNQKAIMMGALIPAVIISSIFLIAVYAPLVKPRAPVNLADPVNNSNATTYTGTFTTGITLITTDSTPNITTASQTVNQPTTTDNGIPIQTLDQLQAMILTKIQYYYLDQVCRVSTTMGGSGQVSATGYSATVSIDASFLSNVRHLIGMNTYDVSGIITIVPAASNIRDTYPNDNLAPNTPNGQTMMFSLLNKGFKPNMNAYVKIIEQTNGKLQLGMAYYYNGGDAYYIHSQGDSPLDGVPPSTTSFTKLTTGIDFSSYDQAGYNTISKGSAFGGYDYASWVWEESGRTISFQFPSLDTNTIALSYGTPSFTIAEHMHYNNYNTGLNDDPTQRIVNGQVYNTNWELFPSEDISVCIPFTSIVVQAA
jgi:hypothetical protein